MALKLELVVIPVSEVDRAKDFHTNVAGFRLDVDHRAGDFRVVQLTPPGSACSITLMRNDRAAGSVKGLHLIVSDIDAARAELVARGLNASEIFHFDAGRQVPGPDPQRASYGSIFSFDDPRWNRLARSGGQRTESARWLNWHASTRWHRIRRRRNARMCR